MPGERACSACNAPARWSYSECRFLCDGCAQRVGSGQQQSVMENIAERALPPQLRVDPSEVLLAASYEKRILQEGWEGRKQL